MELFSEYIRDQYFKRDIEFTKQQEQGPYANEEIQQKQLAGGLAIVYYWIQPEIIKSNVEKGKYKDETY